MNSFYTKIFIFFIFSVASYPIKSIGPGTVIEMPNKLFQDIENNSLVNVKQRIEKHRNLLLIEDSKLHYPSWSSEYYYYDKRTWYTPVNYALRDDRVEIFKYLLEQGSCTHITRTETLLSDAADKCQLECLKILLSSNKLCNKKCSHYFSILESDWLLQIASLFCCGIPCCIDWYNTSIHHSNQQGEEDHSVRAFHAIMTRIDSTCSFNQNSKKIAYLLLAASPTNQSLYTKLSHPLLPEILKDTDKTITFFKDWVSNDCYPFTERAIRSFLWALFVFRTLTPEFKRVVANPLITLKDFAELNECFEDALIVRNTENISALLQRLMPNQEYEPAKNIINKLKQACKNHEKLWKPYADEITALINHTQQKYSAHQKFNAILFMQKQNDTYFFHV